MDRFSKLTGRLNLRRQVGLEIGPLCWPVVSKNDGNVFYADELATVDLRNKYATVANVDLDRIVEVDYVTGARSLTEVFGKTAQFDYVIASHVIEHVPDPITFLQEASDLIKPGGHICLAVPDRRYTFDYHRLVSEFGEWVEAYLLKRVKASPKQVFSHFSLMAVPESTTAWAARAPNPEILHSLPFALTRAKEAVENDRYIDVHCYVYTPRSFVGNLRNCFELDLLKLKVSDFWDTALDQNEFIVILERLPETMDFEARLQEQLASLPNIPAGSSDAGSPETPPPDWTLLSSNSKGSDGSVFVVYRGKRFWVPTVEWALQSGYTWPDDIRWVSDHELGRLAYAPGLPTETRPQ